MRHERAGQLVCSAESIQGEIQDTKFHKIIFKFAQQEHFNLLRNDGYLTDFA